jgi:hypothetical protein
MTPVAARLKLRLDDRARWFRNEWFFKWHHIGGQPAVTIDMFDGRQTHYAGIAFSGTPRDVYWDAAQRGIRREIVEQLAWVEEAIATYAPAVARTAIDECAGLIIGFARGIRRLAVEKDRILRGDGINFPPERDEGQWRGATNADIVQQAEAIKALLPPETDASAPTRVARETSMTSKPYQVALSFAGEQRSYVREVASALAARGIAVFYDEFEAVNLWGKDGVEHFHQVFATDAAYVVMFISAEYVAKSWPRHERRAALSRAITEDREFVLPVRFDDTDVPGIPSTGQYLKAQDYAPAALAVLILEKIGIAPLSVKASDVPPPHSDALSGEVTFDFSAHNGRYVIGTGPMAFETQWSKSDGSSMVLYNDPASINGVAIAKDASSIAEIEDASTYDFTSRTRRPRVHEVAILRNRDGFYAALEILDVKDNTRGAGHDALTFRYSIQSDGSPRFARDRAEAVAAA